MNVRATQFLQWLRWPNLLIILLTLGIIRYGLLGHEFQAAGLSNSLDTFSFILVCLYTLIITFSGYVVNDLYDQNTDAQNKPHKRAVGVWISETRAKAVYLALIFTGLIIAFYLDHIHADFYWTGLYLVLVLLLWLYSSRLKGSILWGNLLVSILCAAVVWIVPMAEKEVLKELNNSSHMMLTLLFYAAFAGMSNMLREVIKDAEDRDGDSESGLRTLAVVYGSEASRVIATGVGILLLLMLLLFLWMDFREVSTRLVFAFLTIPLLLIILIRLQKKAALISWKNLSVLAKLLMLAGLLGLLFLL